MNMIENAKKYLGKPYVWGGESDAEGGYDCSGFVYNVLNDSGIKVGRTTAQGYSKLGTEVSYSNAMEGDLLFFGTSRSSITHIAIYAGNGKMYESQGGSKNTKKNPGKGVTLANVNRRKDLVLVKRVYTEQREEPTSGTNSYKVICTAINVRKGVGTTYPIIKTLKTNDIFKISKVENGWGFIPSLNGYISLNSKYVKEI